MKEDLSAETPRLRSFLKRLVMDSLPLDVDDLCQETLDRALRYRDSFDGSKPLRPWLQGIAFRVFLDERERCLKRQESFGASGDPETAPDPRLRAGISRAEVDALLDHLPDPEDRILRRVHLDSRRIQDVAEEMDLAVGTVKSHLHRGRRRLAERFQAEDWLG